MQEMTHRHTRELDVFYNEHSDACTNCGRRFQNGMCAHLGYDTERNPVVLCDDCAYANDTPALNAHTALRGAPTSMGRGETPVELMPSAVRFLPIYSSFMVAWNDSLCCRLKKGR